MYGFPPGFSYSYEAHHFLWLHSERITLGRSLIFARGCYIGMTEGEVGHGYFDGDCLTEEEVDEEMFRTNAARESMRVARRMRR
jgi:hypothetical protein